MSKEFMFALPVFLTDVELGHYSKQQSDLWLKWGRLNQEKKDNAATFKRMIDQVESELDEVSRIVNEGSEERPVMCKWMFNYDENEKILIRLDSNAIVERKTISKEEMERWRNPELPIETPENVEEGDEATDTFTEGEELAEGGETEEIDAISSPDASTLVEEAENKVDEVSKEDLDKDWPDAPKGQQDLIKNIDKERKCCMPKDRDFHRDGDIRIMYCTICKLIIYKEDVTTTPYSHVPFEKGELFEEVAA
ncbi:MAG: hypothetical protein A2Y38_16280 [Spirochaetes bacterium GWB1_59_5]|nr:MAG: hypothetical protein A2Y38_16280 [Spirochaetes bacterium GWB1_59_5]